MIDPKEVRIGNYLHETINNKTYETQIELTDFSWWAAAGGEERYHPIPITPEWLERLGFVLPGEHGLYRDDDNSGWEIAKDTNGYDVDFYLCHDSIGQNLFSIPIWHVHELQNLYYALTGEELKLKDIERTTTAD